MERLLLSAILTLTGISGLAVALWGGYYLLTGFMSWRKTVAGTRPGHVSLFWLPHETKNWSSAPSLIVF